MRRKLTRILAFVLAAVLLLSLLPAVFADAAAKPDEDGDIQGEMAADPMPKGNDQFSLLTAMAGVVFGVGMGFAWMRRKES